jgi:excisionase family DNA binding protein
MEEREEFLTARQLAAYLQVSESTVRRLAAKRRIPSVRLAPRIIRFHLDAVRDALDVPRYRIRHGEYEQRVDDAQLTFDDFFLS